jgi:hypothetical protein
MSSTGTWRRSSAATGAAGTLLARIAASGARTVREVRQGVVDGRA